MRINSALMLAAIMLAGYLNNIQNVTAQDASVDFLGVIIDSEHPTGYRDYVEMGCWQCHGFQGTAGRPLRGNLLPYETFANHVRRPYGVMPAYSTNILSEKRLRIIYQYLDSLPPEPDASDIPLLTAE